MRIFTQDDPLIAYGAGYLRFVSVSYLMMGISQMLLAVMKSEHTAESGDRGLWRIRYCWQHSDRQAAGAKRL